MPRLSISCAEAMNIASESAYSKPCEMPPPPWLSLARLASGANRRRIARDWSILLNSRLTSGSNAFASSRVKSLIEFRFVKLTGKLLIDRAPLRRPIRAIDGSKSKLRNLPNLPADKTRIRNTPVRQSISCLCDLQLVLYFHPLDSQRYSMEVSRC